MLEKIRESPRDYQNGSVVSCDCGSSSQHRPVRYFSEDCVVYLPGGSHLKRTCIISFADSNYDFVAMVFESGAVNAEGLQVLKQILRCASKRSGMGHSAYSSRAWARVSCCIQISVAQMILNRDSDDSPSSFVDMDV